MSSATPSLEVIEDFLAQKRIAMIGLSRDPNHFSVSLFRELCRRGYEVIPVNPNATEIFGHHCFPRVQDVQPAVEGALLMTTPEVTETVVTDCAAAGIPRIWMYRATGKGAVSLKAVAFCQEHGIQVVPGQCPFMFLPGGESIHRFHGFLRKIMGRYPKRHNAA
jgi:hypothetical protein